MKSYSKQFKNNQYNKRKKVKILIKNIIILTILITNFYVIPVHANATRELQIRLKKINSFYANFIQNVINLDGNVIQEGKGELWIQRPNLFNWHLISPDEHFLISDGHNLWFYNPLIKQVSITLLKETMIDTPFIFITRNNSIDWKSYNIIQNGNKFILKEKKSEKNFFSITIKYNGTIQEFSTIEENGQKISYNFKSQTTNNIDKNKFQFILPKNVTIDDQRSNKNL
ncbi:outer membrane lipoprotein chaperone LolA [Arsenophonus symbiont of Ornithomya chloropus]|uniref:outer membrane lipoprotein chaperone LolA n=1 Tax=Arsenophonus symbiont of Ornithomya chloropus TaxID=634121 RepID=UPI003D6D6FFF